MRRTPLKKISVKQGIKLKLWDKITRERIEFLKEKYGQATCEYCGTKGYEFDSGSLFYLRGHHLDGNRNNNTPANCMVLHNLCHQKIHDKNIKVKRELKDEAEEIT